MEKLLELPNELVEMIFSFIPRKDLKSLTTVPLLANYANRSIFSSVVIDPKVKYTRPTEVFTDDHIPVIISPKELLAVAKVYGSFPKRIKFIEPFDALTLANQCPQYLMNAKIHLRLWDFDQKKKLQKFIEEFKLNPFIVDTISNDSRTPGEPDYDNPVLWELIKNVTSFIDSDKCYKVFNKIESLTSLSIYNHMKPDKLRRLPRQLKKLTCICDGDNGREPKFDNLLCLESLFFTYAILPRGNTPPAIDISQLSKLHTLEISQYYGRPVPWVLPFGLKQLEVSSIDILQNDWNKTCPNLVKLYIRHFQTVLIKPFLNQRSIEFPVNNDANEKLIHTTQLKYLEIPSNFLSNFGERNEPKTWRQVKVNDPVRIRFELPSSLETLSLFNERWDTSGPTTLLDFCNNNLKSLKEIEIFGIRNLNCKGAIPSSVVKAKLMSVGINELLPFSFSLNLVQLSLSDLKFGQVFSMPFPDSLRKLKLKSSNIQRANIVANGLEYLNLERNDFRTLNDETLIIPQGLKELDLSNNKIDGVDMKLPPKLNVLKLHHNKIRVIKHIPMHLKTFECQDNELGSVVLKSNLPVSLIRLDFRGNKIDDNWFSTINISALTGLKNLFLAGNKLTVFDPGLLPDSLVELDLSMNQIASLTNLFQKLKDLNSIYLQRNKLQGYFSNKRENKEDVFGENIRTINVECNGLTRHDIIGLFTEISKKENFERLDVEEELIPPLLKEADSRQRKMRRLD